MLHKKLLISYVFETGRMYKSKEELTCSIMKPIGGFFELELPEAEKSYHPKAIALSTGRACLRLMLRNVYIKKCYVPFYTCDALFHPFQLENVPIKTYRLNAQLEPEDFPDLEEGEYFLYINYFGVRSQTVERLLQKYGERLIIDNTHLFFHCGYPQNWSFTSARKYFGVPDGAFLYAPVKIDTTEIASFTNASVKHNVLRLMGLQTQAHYEYTEYEKSLTSDINTMSVVTKRLLALVDYEKVKEARLKNFWYLHEQIGHLNQISISGNMTDVPFAYPFLPEKLIDKALFYDKGFFIPSLWIDPYKRYEQGYEFDRDLSLKLMPLPIDHRYDTEDLQPLAELIILYSQYS